MRRWIIGGLAGVLFPVLAAAEPVGGKAARKMLFGLRGVEVVLVEDSGLSGTEIQYVRMLMDSPDFRQLGKSYYGAMAYSSAFISRIKSDGADAARSGLVQFVEGFHSPAAADAAALGACDASRRSGEAACVIALRILPKRFKPQPVTLSLAATAAFRQYRRADEPKALAASAGSRAFRMATGEGAAALALAACNAEAGAAGSPDCEVVVAD